MDDCIINPARGKKEPNLPPIGILAVNPTDSTSFAGLAGRLGLTRQALFHAQLYRNDAFFLAGPAVGAPMAAICLEKLIVLGAKEILVYGWCGSLQPSLAAGSLFVPTEGLSEEGTSVHYPGAVWDEENNSLRQRILARLTAAGYEPHRGCIWTTDAVYRETREKVERYQAQGIMAVDMEYTALRTVAAFRRVSLAAVMLVSDELFHRQWSPRLHRQQFHTQSRQLLEQLCAFIHSGIIE